ncbi:MAG: beta galactosidase jelly roll domain-containing protein [Phycisphaerales bacterium]|nr:beta galactosidase jelly roll domain-containing protein [Phycisphaerales bacterium]
MVHLRETPLAALLLALVAAPMTLAQPSKVPLRTRWAADVSPLTPLPEYPRPTLVRSDWLSLNGPWQWAPAPAEPNAAPPDSMPGQILVPFPIESALSGVAEHHEHLWYRRAFEVPAEWQGKRVLLHFGAVDWEAQVWVNGKPIGSHQGGYDPFTFDITDALAGSGPQTLVVRVDDPTDGSTQPRGKQVRKPEGIWYTPTTGIWQSVWIEPVPQASIERLHIEPDYDRQTVTVSVDARGQAKDADVFVVVTVPDEARTLSAKVVKPGEPAEIDLSTAFRPWSPDKPDLYTVLVALESPGGESDNVESYFGVRKIEIKPDAQGITRIHLNNKPTFLLGPLDQGFWPDGLYTAPTDEALKYDLDVTKRLGFNAVRKHVKVEPERWYYWCDTMGLAVIQDMPSGDKYIGPDDPDILRSPASARQYEKELTAIIDANREHPSVVMWVPFNEGWGQFDTARIVSLIRKLDPTRLVDATTGWADRGVGDLYDAHIYPGPGSPKPEASRAAFLGEFGGLGLPLEGHTWQAKGNWGYRSFDSRDALTDAYVNLMHNMRWLVADPGLSGAIYTQTTDVEVEVNGLMTYDRAILKMDEQRVREANLAVLGPAPTVRVIAPSSRDEAVEWRYTTTEPAPGWEKPGFDDSAWTNAPGGFGRDGTPGAVNRTKWESGDIWIRRQFVLPRIVLANPNLVVHHDEGAEVYLNGVLAAKLDGYSTEYSFVPISSQARAALVGGPTVIAIHCHQTAGGQYIDAGLVDLADAPAERP